MTTTSNKVYAKVRRYQWVNEDGDELQVDAYTRSEARAYFKERLGLSPRDRLPVGTVIKRVV